MSSRKMPARLTKEPLIEVLCAVHFTSQVPAETLLPGLLLSKLAFNSPKIETLAAAQLPQFVRENDPNLQNAPLLKIMVDDRHFVLIGSKWLAVGCEMPYSGWNAYKEIIVSVFSLLKEAVFIEFVDRYSLRYVDFIKSQDAPSSLSNFNVSIKIADKVVSDEQTQLRVEVVDGPFLHAVSIVTKANLNKPDERPVEGALLDVDSHRIERMSLPEFTGGLDGFLDEIHAANKSVFFGLLSNTGLDALGPIYA